MNKVESWHLHLDPVSPINKGQDLQGLYTSQVRRENTTKNFLFDIKLYIIKLYDLWNDLSNQKKIISKPVLDHAGRMYLFYKINEMK